MAKGAVLGEGAGDELGEGIARDLLRWIVVLVRQYAQEPPLGVLLLEQRGDQL